MLFVSTRKMLIYRKCIFHIVCTFFLFSFFGSGTSFKKAALNLILKCHVLVSKPVSLCIAEVEQLLETLILGNPEACTFMHFSLFMFLYYHLEEVQYHNVIMRGHRPNWHIPELPRFISRSSKPFTQSQSGTCTLGIKLLHRSWQVHVKYLTHLSNTITNDGGFGAQVKPSLF